jgi:hypothetical protein
MIRGYLMHLTHYDSEWIKRKHLEKRFDLKLALSLVDDMARAGLNTLILDVEDAVTYRTHPELQRAYTAPMADYRRIVAEARSRGLTVIPKLNFAKGVDMHNGWMSPYNEMPDTNRRYFEHALQIVDELIEGLDLRYFHIGMDEDCRSTALYLQVIRKLHRALAKRRLRTVMWADIGHSWTPIRNAKTRAVLPDLPRDIVMMPWTYDQRSQRRWVRMLADMGFEVWGGTGPDPANIAMWAEDIVRGGGHGLVATLWTPLDAEHTPAQRALVADSGRMFPRKEGSGT